MSTNRVPLALKVFGWSLVWGMVCAYAAFRAILFIDERFHLFDPRLTPIFAVMIALAFGVAGAVTGGVITGKNAKS